MAWSTPAGGVVDATCRDVSLGGCFLETPSPPPVGARVTVRLPSSSLRAAEAWEVSATVRWSTPRGMGVQFGLMGAHQTADLVALMRASSSPTPRPAPVDPLDAPGLLENDRFPRSNAYHPRWLLEPRLRMHPLWTMEWLCERLPLAPHMRVLHVGCDGARSAIFLAREWGVQVIAADPLVDPDESQARIDAAGCGGAVIPIRLEAGRIPFAQASFDMGIHVDLADGGPARMDPQALVALVKPGGRVAFASAGLTSDLRMTVPAHVARFVDDAPGVHQLDGIRRRLERAGATEAGEGCCFPDGNASWIAWAEANARPDAYLHTLRAYGARYLGVFGFVAVRRAEDAARRVEAPPLFRPDSPRAA